jgi:hypothetical protein
MGFHMGQFRTVDQVRTQRRVRNASFTMNSRPTLLFVHGTGVREAGYLSTLKLIEQNVQSRDWQISVKGCFWGTSQGARLNLQGASIPGYDDTRRSEPSAEDELIALWSILYTDPWYELRVLRNMPLSGPFPFGREPPSTLLDRSIRNFIPSQQLIDLLELANLRDFFDESRETLIRAPEFREAVATAPANPLEHRCAIARALIAHTLRAFEEARHLSVNGALRDTIVEQLTNDLHGFGLGVGTFLLRPVTGLALGMVTNMMMGDRGTISDRATPTAGDILRYLAQGESMRHFIRKSVSDIEGGPVIVLAHSLGGIMCADLLISQAIQEVSALVTLGSQAPLFYEIGALPSLGSGELLPEHFPQWVNIYDRRDLLSYVGATVFGGRVTDVEVKNGQPFPQSHSAYWSNPEVWTAIGQILP